MPRSPDQPPCGPCARVPSLTGLSSSGSRFLAASGCRGVCPDRPKRRLPTSDPETQAWPALLYRILSLSGFTASSGLYPNFREPQPSRSLGE
jgi:hypothetical protein